MTRPPAEVGMSVDRIDTPALVVDLDAYTRNLDRMAGFLAGRPLRLRPHAKTHKCPAIALDQVARGAVGVCCQKVSEAEAMVAGGVRDVLVSNEIVGAAKIARLCRLASQAVVAVCADHAENVRQLAAAARDAGVRLPVLVEIDVGANRCGVEPGEPAAVLAALVAESPALRFAGLQAYQGRAQHIADPDARRTVIDLAVDKVRATLEAVARRGLSCEVVSGAGTGSFPFEAASGVYTELQAGSYVFMDRDYKRVQGFPAEFEHALFVLTTVMSRPARDRAVVDAGLKAFSVDAGMPAVRGMESIEVQRASDEHGVLLLRDPEMQPALGDRLWLVPGHCDPTVNLYDWYVAVRGAVVDGLWPITARGAVL